MKTEYLESLGLSKDVIDKIMAENGKDVEAEKAKTTAKGGELDKANQAVKDLQETVGRYDGKDPAKLEQDLKDLRKKYDDDVAAEQAKAKTIQKEFVLREALRSNGVADPEYLIFKAGGVEKFAFSGDKPVGLEDTLKPYRDSIPHAFAAENKQPVKTGMRQTGTEGAPDKNQEVNQAFRSLFGKE